MPIREFFHLIHVVDDIASANERFGVLFGEARFNENWSDLDRRWASFMMLGDTMVELIQPSDAPEDRHQALTKFYSRFGQHLHSLSWYVDVEDMPALFEAFLGRECASSNPAVVRFPTAPRIPGQTIFTHPKDTAGQMEFVGVQIGPLPFDPRSSVAWTPTPPGVSPLTILGVSHFTMGAIDPLKLKELYERVHVGTDASRRSQQRLPPRRNSVGRRAGGAGVARLTPAAPRCANGQLPHAVTFRVADLEAAERHVATVGVRVLERAGEAVVLTPDDMFGAVVVLTELRALRLRPGDGCHQSAARRGHATVVAGRRRGKVSDRGTTAVSAHLFSRATRSSGAVSTGSASRKQYVMCSPADWL